LSNFQFCPSYLTIFAVLTRVDYWLWPVDRCWPVDQFDCPIAAWHVAQSALSLSRVRFVAFRVSWTPLATRTGATPAGTVAVVLVHGVRRRSNGGCAELLKWRLEQVLRSRWLWRKMLLRSSPTIRLCECS